MNVLVRLVMFTVSFFFFSIFSLLLVLQAVRNATGGCHETMTSESWNVEEFVGKNAQVKLIDNSPGGWDHINFDDLRGDITCRA